ncbi:hypothetical protein LIER_38974 [Lithospermum erythrorhizon]|uniref:Uncharacterized protein n=1 Tax=Lithospermum erythrorhizon TaxID=34254 RepID=A0AAV3Q9N2_LITER
MGFSQGGFGTNVRHHWSLSTSILCSEDSTKTQAGVEKLRTGFPRALPHEVFCDGDVLIKAGLTKGVDKFPNTTLRDLLSLKHSSGDCVMLHKVNFKVVTTGKDHLARISKRQSAVVSKNSSGTPPLAPASKKSQKITKKVIPEDAPVITVHPGLDIVPSTQESAPINSSSKTSSSSGSDFLGVHYSFPLGITVTEKTVSQREEPTASLLLKNYMLKGDMEGIMGYSIPTELHEAFSHF